MSSRQPPAGEALGQTRLGSGIREVEISDWTCFSCGGALTQAHEGDYFHTADDSTCFDPIPVPTSPRRAVPARQGAKQRTGA